MAKLDEYRNKRDPSRTAEPMPGKRAAAGAGNSFVVQEHHASALHWDFRLERDGVLVSWAVPKGLPPDPKVNHLAVHTEDHPLDYATFEGTIAAGEYGGGEVILWDRGRYELEKWTDREVKVVLHGERVQGRFVLFQTGGKNWMMHRMDGAPADWSALPDDVMPMLAKSGTLPDDAGWAFEMKWDGVRALVRVEGGRIRITSADGEDVTARYPELRALGEAMGSTQALLDGEIVGFDADGRPSAAALQRRSRVASASEARRLAVRDPIVFLLFDVLHLDGRSTMSLPYSARRDLLGTLDLGGPSWQTPPAFDESGAAAVRASFDQGLDGVVAKRLTSHYAPGRRSSDWVAVKNVRTQGVVIGGWLPSRGRGVGALLLGLNEDGALRYIGKVSAGLTDDVRGELLARLNRLARKTSPFRPEPPRADIKDAQWVTPRLVGDVAFSDWTAGDRLRLPSWRGLRTDRKAGDVSRDS